MKHQVVLTRVTRPLIVPTYYHADKANINCAWGRTVTINEILYILVFQGTYHYTKRRKLRAKMSGTNHSATESDVGPGPACILVQPQMGENIGAAARAMWNFGLDHMRLVAPRDGWPNPKAEATASGAGQVMDNVQVFEKTPDALADFSHVYATTARSRDLTNKIVTPETAMKDAQRRIGKGEKVAILFGPERAGLANEDIVQANTLVSIPVNPAFASLNLAQSVLLLAYEWRRVSAETEEESIEFAGAAPATQIEIEKLVERLTLRLDERGFFFPEDKAANMKLNLRNMFSRFPLTDADVRTLHGIIRQFTERS